MSTPSHISAILRVKLDFKADKPSVVRRHFIQAIRATVLEARDRGDLELVIAEECLATLPSSKPRQ